MITAILLIITSLVFCCLCASFATTQLIIKLKDYLCKEDLLNTNTELEHKGVKSRFTPLKEEKEEEPNLSKEGEVAHGSIMSNKYEGQHLKNWKADAAMEEFKEETSNVKIEGNVLESSDGIVHNVSNVVK